MVSTRVMCFRWGVFEMNRQFIIINNRAYDAITGLPLDDMGLSDDTASQPSAVSPSARGIKTKSIHQSATQSSTTLSRRYTPRPAHTTNTPAHQPESTPANEESFAKINHFATKKPAPVTQHQQTPIQVDRPAQAHPVVERAKGKQIDFSAPRNKRLKQQQMTMQNSQIAGSPAKNSPKPARELKNEAIQRALSQEIDSQKTTSTKTRKKFFSGWSKVVPAGLAIMLLGGYLTYLSMPNISIRMASVQSGINAKYPNYQPNGYSLSGPIALKDGEVSMKFAYADGNQSYTLTQQKSNWDSSAVRQYVDSKNQNAIITQSNGLTIYTYDNNAAWVNGGVLYTLVGDAPLSNNQIQRIATSM